MREMMATGRWRAVRASQRRRCRQAALARLVRLVRLATLVRSRVPELGEAEAVEFAGIVWVLAAGAWPMANPAPVVASVLADPRFAAMCVDFVPAMTRTLS